MCWQNLKDLAVSWVQIAKEISYFKATGGLF
jgi:hypothetical protein